MNPTRGCQEGGPSELESESRSPRAATRRCSSWSCFVAGVATLLVSIIAVVATETGAGAVTTATSACTAPAVAVVVDFGHWNEPAIRVCVPWSETLTGASLLQRAGFTTAGTVHDGPAFVCRLGFPSVRGGTQLPTADPPDGEACVMTPPASAYWGYWHALPGSEVWSYSQQGFMTYHPPPGSVDVWTFGSTGDGGTRGQPSFSTASVLPSPAPPPTVAPTTGRSSGQSPAAVPGTDPNGVSATTASSTTAGIGAHIDARRPDADVHGDSAGIGRSKSSTLPARAGGGGGDGLEPATARIRTFEASSTRQRPRPSGSPLPTLVALIVILAIGAVTIVVARSRTRRGPTTP